MTDQEKIAALLNTLAHVYVDAQMALEGRWDCSGEGSEGFEDQQTMILDCMRATDLQLPLEQIEQYRNEDEA